MQDNSVYMVTYDHSVMCLRFKGCVCMHVTVCVRACVFLCVIERVFV